MFFVHHLHFHLASNLRFRWALPMIVVQNSCHNLLILKMMLVLVVMLKLMTISIMMLMMMTTTKQNSRHLLSLLTA